MKSAQSSPATTPIISRVVNEERFPSRKHLKHVSNSVVGESSAPEDTVLLKRADSSPSVAVDFSTDQWENTHKLLLASEDGDPITSETTSVSTIESDASSGNKLHDFGALPSPFLFFATHDVPLVYRLIHGLLCYHPSYISTIYCSPSFSDEHFRQTIHDTRLSTAKNGA